VARLTFEDSRCKGCSLCVQACPKKILHLSADKLNSKGYHPVEVSDQRECIGCAFCALICPDCVITVEK